MTMSKQNGLGAWTTLPHVEGTSAPPSDPTQISETVWMKKRLERRVAGRVMVVEERNTMGGRPMYDVIVGERPLASDSSSGGTKLANLSVEQFAGLVELLQAMVRKAEEP
jgi:hypothetical protein